MNRRAGFTLMEVCLAVAIIMLLLMVAMPSIRSVFEGQKLHRVYEEFDALVAKAQVRSVNERRSYALVWQKDGIDLVPMEKREGETPGSVETLPFTKEQDYAIERPAALDAKAPPIWTFWRSGACEPAIVTYKGPEGTWKARYEALTARRTLLDESTP